ncbi:hypothetical protein [Halalkalirubrum salinum]|uniref:hypothetical protein n=1 Tax=Halalkalirubrum salinum TaxID=2563889 RepID=UPI0010FB28E4|nr:hypothetical protein [Halalkalirubrum salinum]
MGGSDKGAITLLIGGVLYGILKLGGEFVRVFDVVVYALRESFILRLTINRIGQAVAEIELTIETIVLGLLTVFLVIAILDYVLTEI